MGLATQTRTSSGECLLNLFKQMEIVVYSDQAVWSPTDHNPILSSFLASPLPICLCTQLDDATIASPNGFLAQRGGLPTRIVKPLLGSIEGVTIIDYIDVPIVLETQEQLNTIVTNAVNTQGSRLQAAINLFRYASAGSGYPYHVFCFYGPIDLTGCTIPFTPPPRPLFLKTPTSPIQVMIASAFDAPKILTGALDAFTGQINSTLVQVDQGQGYLVSIGLVNYINLDVALNGMVETYPRDVWSQLLIQYLENPFPKHSTFPVKTTLIVVLALVLFVFQLRALARLYA